MMMVVVILMVIMSDYKQNTNQVVEKMLPMMIIPGGILDTTPPFLTKHLKLWQGILNFTGWFLTGPP